MVLLLKVSFPQEGIDTTATDSVKIDTVKIDFGKQLLIKFMCRKDLDSINRQAQQNQKVLKEIIKGLDIKNED